ncbi:MAG: sulfite exporter TauE/SafE family protein [Bacteroidetes bacterium]|nr:sulfite exporter TauE/SafE family protein [Bacteroidota bacterium]MBS1541542.1 sulfite exporter TauE/SafE family protein [Bacteroidota bacterium]
MVVLGVILIGIIAGVMSGLFGIGGGLIIVPALIAFLRLGILQANATSLAAMLLPVGILGVINYYKAGFIHVRDALWVSVGLIAGSFLGAELALSLQVGMLSKFYAAFLFYIAISYFFSRASGSQTKNETTLETSMPAQSFWLFIIVGVLAGVIAGLFGKGGGLVIVPVLVRFFRYNPKAASATSLAALLPPVGLPSVIVYFENGYLNLTYAALMACGIVVGTFFGSKAAIKLPVDSFKKVYAIFLVAVAVYLIFEAR